MPTDWDFSTKLRAEPPKPIVTYGLCVLCAFLTFAYHSPGLSPVLARLGMIAAPGAAQIWDGAYWALLTTFFVHGDIMHILFNMMIFIQLGRAMEAVLAPWAFILFLAAAAAVSCGCELAVTGIQGVGASGAVYAMFGLMWMGRDRYREWRGLATERNMQMFLVWGVICIVGTLAGFMHIANVAHFSGLLFGFAVGALFLAPTRKLIWAAPLALTIALAALSLFWLPWNAEWTYHRGSKAFAAKDFHAAVSWYHRSLKLGGSRYYNWENIKRAWVNIEDDAIRRHDYKAAEEAQRQQESAGSLEGPDPSTQREQPAGPTFHMPGEKK